MLKPFFIFNIVLGLLFFSLNGTAQEFEAALYHDFHFNKSGQSTAQKPTALGLPFFDDFTTSNTYPDPSKWVDNRSVYINNTMATGLKSRGVATFDAYNSIQIPYDTTFANASILGDSLVSLAIDLSNYTPSDSVILSFFYQAKGLGYAPKPQDSLIVYFLKNNSIWQRVWSANADDFTDFTAASIAITDTNFFHDQFQFKIATKATFGISNSHWHLDYVFLNNQRSVVDTFISDVAFTRHPRNLLNDFTAMPFRHFKTQPSAFLQNSAEAYLRNNGFSITSLEYNMQSVAMNTGQVIGQANGNSIFSVDEEKPIHLSMPAIENYPLTDPNGNYTFKTTFSATPFYLNEPSANDTIVHYQVFDNYFAYDDGTAEQSYFLNLFPNAPGHIAVEYALYMPDTIRGVAINFPRTVPSSSMKEFSLAIYKSIAVDGQQDDIVYQENFLLPIYQEEANAFSNYIFETPVVMNEGVYYVVLTQAAGGMSDSLYIGLDKNRTGANHRYFNVEGIWQSSLLDGALMMRPLVGKALPPSQIEEVVQDNDFVIYPNPAQELINIQFKGSKKPLNYHFELVNLEGKIVKKGFQTWGSSIDISQLVPGIYHLRLVDNAGRKVSKKLIKYSEKN